MLFIGNARGVINTIFSGLLPTASPSSRWSRWRAGIGWVPFILETMDGEFASERCVWRPPGVGRAPSGLLQVVTGLPPLMWFETGAGRL